MRKNGEERMLTVQEVVARLRVHPNTVRRWLAAGELKGARLGGTKAGWRIPESEVERYVADRMRRPN
jgi:excisionase family DNA binding protein